jgi:hypothetical protein
VAISVAALIERLQADVPEYDGAPTGRQYRRAVLDAVSDLSARKPIVKSASLDVISGQASYVLPEDFLRFITLEIPAAQDGVIVTGDGVVPIGARSLVNWRTEVSGLTLTLDPTPTFDFTYTLRYAAKHALTGNEPTDRYETLTDELVSVALLKARSIALGFIAAKVSRDAWLYKEAEQQVDKRQQSVALRTEAVAANDEYVAAIKALAPAQSGGSFEPAAGDLAWLGRM